MTVRQSAETSSACERSVQLSKFKLLSLIIKTLHDFNLKKHNVIKIGKRPLGWGDATLDMRHIMTKNNLKHLRGMQFQGMQRLDLKVA